MPGQLRVSAGPDQGLIFPLPEGKPLVIGRGHSADARVNDARVSRVHCKVEIQGGAAVLTDAGSSTGTLVNGQPVIRHELRPGDAIVIGDTQLRYETEPGQEPATVLLPKSFPNLAAMALAMPEPIYRHHKPRTELDVLVLTITEPQLLDGPIAEALRLELLMAVSHAKAQKVVLDFQHVKALGSAAFRPLISLQRHLQQSGGRLLLCGLSSFTAQVFRIAGLINLHEPASAPFEAEADSGAAVRRMAK